MHITPIRHQLHLYRKQALIILLLIVFQQCAFAQMNIYEHDSRYLQRNFHFGISLALNRANYKITLDSNYLGQGEILEAHALTDPGFSLGILSDYHISRSFELRFLPDLAFSDRTIQYKLSTADTLALKKIESVYLEFPVHLKYRSKPYKDFRMYVLGGFKYSIDMQSNAQARLAENLVKVYKNDISAEWGVGMEFHLPIVIISPEIKISYGLLNVLKPDDNLNFSRVLDKLRTRTVMFAIHFEG
jgi:hypothetical protein